MVNETSNRVSVGWERVKSVEGLDETRYLGARSDLPEAARPGDWCKVRIVDDLGEIEWTFLAVEPARPTSIFEEDVSRFKGRGPDLGTGFVRTRRPW